MSQESRGPACSKLHSQSLSILPNCHGPGQKEGEREFGGGSTEKPSRITFAKDHVTSQVRTDPQRAGMGIQFSSQADWAPNAQGRGGGCS